MNKRDIAIVNMRANRRPPNNMRRQQTLINNGASMEFADENIFARQERIEMQMHQPDKERPRANLYNVIKKLREDVVSDNHPLRRTLCQKSVTYQT